MSDPSSESPAQTENLTTWLRRITAVPINIVARSLLSLGFTPNSLTVLGLLISVGAAVLAGLGLYLSSGLVLIFGAVFDAFDGAVARLTGRVTDFGALLDSTLDRYGEALILGALGYHLAREGQWTGLILSLVALLGSLMVSYVRARSEGLQIENKVGLLTRVERIVVLALALITGQVMIGLWVLAVGANFTVLQRVIQAARSTRKDSR